jgi:hypothetical protein
VRHISLSSLPLMWLVVIIIIIASRVALWPQIERPVGHPL